MSKKRRLRALEDKDAIRELTARYCFAVARADIEQIAALFCKDGEFAMTGVVFRGRDEIRTGYGGSLSGLAPKPFIHNHVIELDGDGERARGICAVEIRAVQDGEAYTAAGHYDDEYRREDGEWRFARRRFEVDHWVPLRQGWGPAAASSLPIRDR